MKPLNKNMLSFKGPEFVGNLEKYKPKYNFLKAIAGVGLIGLCLITPATNWAILMIFPGFLLQIPINYDKLRETRIGKKVIQLKFRMLRW